jgi:hypothetical protein
MIAVTTLSHIGRNLAILFVPIILSAHAWGQEERTLAMSREVEKVGERQYIVTVTVKKGDHQGYAKLEEMIPESFVPTKKETQGANYIYQDGKAKFIWMDFPSESDFQVVYKLTQKRGKPGTYDIEGRISCVSGEDLLRVEEKSSFDVEEPRLAQGEAQQEDPEEEEEKEARAGGASGEDTVSTDADEEDGKKLASNGKGMTSSTGESPKSDEKEKREESSEEGEKEKRDEDSGSSEEEQAKKNEESKEDEPAWEKEEKEEEEDAYFSIQIGAFGKEKSDSYFEERYSLSPDEIDSYREGGLIKYTTGRYGTYEQARKTKEKLRSKGMKGAFVVGFKGSEPVDASQLRE